LPKWPHLKSDRVYKTNWRFLRNIRKHIRADATVFKQAGPNRKRKLEFQSLEGGEGVPSCEAAKRRAKAIWENAYRGGEKAPFEKRWVGEKIQ